jgi:hypothetical protein
MATAAAQKVEFSGKVDLLDYLAFCEHFDNGRGQPIYGATTWLISTSLKAFLKQVKENPSLKEIVEKGIREMLEDNRE